MALLNCKLEKTTTNQLHRVGKGCRWEDDNDALFPVRLIRDLCSEKSRTAAGYQLVTASSHNESHQWKILRTTRSGVVCAVK